MIVRSWRDLGIAVQENCFRLTRCRPTGPRRAIREEAADPRRATCGGPTARDGTKTHHADPGWQPSRLPRPGPAEPAKRFGPPSNRRLHDATRQHPAVALQEPTPRLPACPDRQPPGCGGFLAHRCRGMTLDHLATSGRTAAGQSSRRGPGEAGVSHLTLILHCVIHNTWRFILGASRLGPRVCGDVAIVGRAAKRLLNRAAARSGRGSHERKNANPKKAVLKIQRRKSGACR